jgi:hypothetical protein
LIGIAKLKKAKQTSVQARITNFFVAQPTNNNNNNNNNNQDQKKKDKKKKDELAKVRSLSTILVSCYFISSFFCF